MSISNASNSVAEILKRKGDKARGTDEQVRIILENRADESARSGLLQKRLNEETPGKGIVGKKLKEAEEMHDLTANLADQRQTEAQELDRALGKASNQSKEPPSTSQRR